MNSSDMGGGIQEYIQRTDPEHILNTKRQYCPKAAINRNTTNSS